MSNIDYCALAERYLVPQNLQFKHYAPACVYVIQWGDDGPVKIGIASDPKFRLGELQVANWMELRLVALVATFAAPLSIEQKAHKIAAAHRLRGEWFDMHPVEAVACVLMAAELCGAEVMPYADASTQAEAMRAAKWKAEDQANEARRVSTLRRKLGID